MIFPASTASVRTRAGRILVVRIYLPRLQASDGDDTEGTLSAVLKREQYSWGLLQGLWKDPPE